MSRLIWLWAAMAVLIVDPAFANGRGSTEVGNAVQVIGTTDLGMCIKKMESDPAGAWYWCNRTVMRNETPDPARAVALVYRSALRLQRGKVQGAIHDADAAIALNPAYGDAYFGRANALATLGRSDETLADYSRALELGTTVADLVHFNRATLFRALGRTAEADLDLERARSLMGPDSPLRDRLAVAP